MISRKPTILSSEKNTISQKTHKKLKENLLNCARTLHQFEKETLRSIKKLKLIDFSKKSRLEELEAFLIFSFIVIIAQFKSNTANFNNCARLILF
jgi:hypothetical protein